MLVYVARRLATGLAVFITVTAASFWLFYLRGGEAVARGVSGQDATLEQIRARAAELGLLDPLAVQYARWLGDLVTGDLGRSFLSSKPVTEIMLDRIPVTLSVVAVSLVLTIAVSILVGVIAATRGGVIDRVLQVMSVVVIAIPGYWLAFILVLVFSLGLRLLPATGYVPITESFGGWLGSIILPAVAIAFAAAFGLGQQIRGALIDALSSDYIRTLRAHGIPRRAIVLRHGLRNAGPAALTLLSLQVISMLGGAVIVERVFALPGLGSMAVEHGLKGDVPVVLGAVVFMVVVVVVVNLAADLMNGLLNPKARAR